LRGKRNDDIRREEWLIATEKRSENEQLGTWVELDQSWIEPLFSEHSIVFQRSGFSKGEAENFGRTNGIQGDEDAPIRSTMMKGILS
jgi:hypothetical protein